MSKTTTSDHYRPPVLKRDHARPRTTPTLSDAAMEAQLTDLVRPHTFALVAEYHRLGLRTRVLSLPVMVAFVLTLIWRQVPSVAELLRMLRHETLLWTPPVHVSQQAVDQRLRCLPASLFAQVFHALLPSLQERAARRSRPLSPLLTRLHQHYPHLVLIDATTLEEVFRKVGLFRGVTPIPLAGKLCGVLDLTTKLPLHLWFDENPAANEKSFLDRFQQVLAPQSLVLFDRGFYAFPFFDWLTDHQVSFLTRARALTAYQVTQGIVQSKHVRDAVIALGQYRSNPCEHPVRLVEIQIGGIWHRYLTNILDPTTLSPKDVLDLYGTRWRIEEAFLIVKRLLGLAYLWTGSFNGIELQIWATWLLYAVLVDLSDAVAEFLSLPLDAISFEMVYRGLYHFAVAHQQGRASDPIAYLATDTSLDVVKRRRKYREKSRLDKLPQELNL